MTRKRNSEAQIISILKELEAGARNIKHLHKCQLGNDCLASAN